MPSHTEVFEVTPDNIQNFKTGESIVKLAVALCQDKSEDHALVAKIIFDYAKRNNLLIELSDKEIEQLVTQWQNWLPALGSHNKDGQLAKQLANLIGDFCFQQMFERNAQPRLVSKELKYEDYKSDLYLETADVDYILQNVQFNQNRFKGESAISPCMFVDSHDGLCQNHNFALHHFLQSQSNCNKFTIPINIKNYHFIALNIDINRQDSVISIGIANSSVGESYRDYEASVLRQAIKILNALLPTHHIKINDVLITQQTNNYTCGDLIILNTLKRHLRASAELLELYNSPQMAIRECTTVVLNEIKPHANYASAEYRVGLPRLQKPQLPFFAHPTDNSEEQLSQQIKSLTL